MRFFTSIVLGLVVPSSLLVGAMGCGNGSSSGSSSGNGGSTGASGDGNLAGNGIMIGLGGSGLGLGLDGSAPDPDAYPTKLPANGEQLTPAFMAADKTKLDGMPVAANAPTVVYPLAHSLFPRNMAPVEIHLKRTALTQTLARVNFHVDTFDYNLFDVCAPAEQDMSGCVLTMNAALCDIVAQASQLGPLTVTVRLADPTGTNVGEAQLVDVAWTYMSLTGGLYYWSAVADPAVPLNTLATQIRRYDFASASGKPEVYWDQATDSPGLMQPTDYRNPTAGSTTSDHACMGCHAVSKDGTKMALSFGGSLPGAFELVDVAKRMPIYAHLVAGAATPTLDGTVPFATMTSFAPDGSVMINSVRGKLMLRSTDSGAMMLADLLPDIAEPKAHPFWSPKGDLVALTSYVAAKLPSDPTDGLTGDMTPSGQIWTAPSDGKSITGPAKVLVAREAGASNFYPAISDDGSLLVFNKSSCTGPVVVNAGWGPGNCDGYNDPSAKLYLVPSAGGTPVELAQANGADAWTNSWPRWSPDHGKFRDQQIYWVAYSSRRPYGLRLAGSTDGSTKPQLWFAAVRVVPGQAPTMDPSYAPVWLPGQNEDMAHPDGNHVPQWVDVAVKVDVK